MTRWKAPAFMSSDYALRPLRDPNIDWSYRPARFGDDVDPPQVRNLAQSTGPFIPASVSSPGTHAAGLHLAGPGWPHLLCMVSA